MLLAPWEPEPLEKKNRSRSRLEKKSGAGAENNLAGSPALGIRKIIKNCFIPTIKKILLSYKKKSTWYHNYQVTGFCPTPPPPPIQPLRGSSLPLQSYFTITFLHTISLPVSASVVYTQRISVSGPEPLGSIISGHQDLDTDPCIEK